MIRPSVIAIATLGPLPWESLVVLLILTAPFSAVGAAVWWLSFASVRRAER